MVVSTAIEIRRLNKERIRNAIQRYEKCTKADIARETALSMATCSTTLNEMLESGEILKVEQTGFNIGRPADVFTYNADYMHILGLCTAVQNGRNMVKYAIADAFGRILTHETIRVDRLDDTLLEALAHECMKQDARIQAVGLGVPGYVQNSDIKDCDISTLIGTNFAERIQEKHHVKVMIENDMNLIAYQLFHECPEKHANFAAIYFPREPEAFVGAGLIVEGRLLKGSSMLAGELHHVARAFGISYEEQRKIMQNREPFCRFVAQMVLVVACTVNPSQVTIMGNGLDENDLRTICSRCLETMPAANVPSIRIDNDVFGNYIEGLVRFTRDSVLYPTLI